MKTLRHRKQRPSRPSSFESLMRSVIYTRNGCQHLAQQIVLRDQEHLKPALDAIQNASVALEALLLACEEHEAAH